MPGGKSHDRKKFERAVEREVQRRIELGPLGTRPNAPPSKIELPSSKRPTDIKRGKFGPHVVAHLRTIEAVSFVLAIGAVLMEDYFWWFVGFFYVGLVIQTLLSINDKSSGWLRYVTATFFVGVITLFSVKVVLGNVYPEVTSEWTEGNYDAGTDIHGIAWQDGWSELIFSLSNTSGSDMNVVDVEFLVDESVERVTIDNNVGCSVVESGASPVEVRTNSANGQQQLMQPGGYYGPYRLFCEHLPAHTGISLILALGDESVLRKVLSGDKLAMKNVGPNLLGPKRMPRWIKYYEKYKVGLRPYSFYAEVNPFQN